MLRSDARITRTAPAPFGSGEPACSTADSSHGHQSLQPLRSESTSHTFSRGALDCADASITCFAIGGRRLQPLARPRLEGANGRLERTALLGEAVLHAHRGSVEHLALHDALG